MIYSAIIKSVRPCRCGCEGSLIIQIGDFQSMVYYQAPDETCSNLSIGLEISVDLWLVYGCVRKIDNHIKTLTSSDNVAGGLIQGQVEKIFNSTDLRVDAGLVVDISNEENIRGVKVGDYIEITGTYQVYFPETYWSKE